MRRRILAAIAVPVLLLVAIGLRVARRPGQQAATGSHETEVPRPVDSTGPSREARLARLDGSLRAIQDGDSLARRDRWDPAYVVSTVGREPDKLFAWVRDSTDWIPYLGRLRGPVGVLMDRQGNDLDRALLLAALLEGAGQTVRLAHGQLPRERAAALLPALVIARPALDSVGVRVPPLASGTLRATAAKYRLDGEALERGLGTQDSAVTRFAAELDGRVSDQSRRLLAQVGGGDPLAEWQWRYERALTALQDHWWVQRQDGELWIDLDLLAGVADSSTAQVIPATETLAPTAISGSLEHELTIRVVGERWSAGKLTEHVALEDTLRPADLYGRAIVLQGWPGHWPAQLHPDPRSKFGLRGAALDQRAWGIALFAGDSALAQGALYDDGGEHQPRGGAGLGGLGGAIAAIGREPSTASGPPSELTAAWIEFELREPGEPRRVVRRAVFDLIGPAARAAGAPAQLALGDAARLTRSLSLMIRTEILPVTARLAPEYITHLAARSVVANAQVLRSLVAADSAHLPDPDTLIAQSAPTLSPLYSLAAARLEWSPVWDRVYVDRLDLLTSHRHPAAFGDGFGIRGAIEVVAGELGVPLMEPDALEIRLRQGVFDTNAEAFWWSGKQVLNTGEAYQTAQSWGALTSDRRADLGSLQLPPDARVRIAQDLDSGFVVVTPTAPVGPERYIGWWRVDPRTGVTRGVVGSGWGQCQEYAQLLRSALITGSEQFAFDYAMCQGLELGINEIKGGIVALQAQGKLTWMGAVEYQNPKSVAAANHRNCTYMAIASGVLATLPIILKVRQVMKMRAYIARREAVAAERHWLAENVAALRKKMLSENLARLGKNLPKELGPAPKFVRLAEEAYKDARRSHMKAFMKWSNYTKSAYPDMRYADQLAEASRRSMGEANEAFETLIEARREAGRLAPPGTAQASDLKGTLPDLEKIISQDAKTLSEIDKTIPDFDKEWATETLEMGFGGVLTGK